MADIRIDLEGFTAWERGLARLIAMLRDLRPFWPRVVPLYIGWVREQFESEGEYFGDGWAPLSGDYLARKMTLFPGKPILQATGQLRRRASTPIRRATPTSLTFVIPEFSRRDGRTMDPAWFQEGTDRMPARPLLPDVLPPVPMAELDEVAQEWIDEMVVRLGLSD